MFVIPTVAAYQWQNRRKKKNKKIFLQAFMAMNERMNVHAMNVRVCV